MHGIKKINIVLVIEVVTCFPFVSMAINSEGFIRNLDYDNLFFSQHFINEITEVRNARLCAGLCGRITNCISFFYNNVEKRCRLHDTTYFLVLDGTSSPGWKMYVLENKECPVHLSFVHDKVNGLCVHVPKEKYNNTAAQLYCSERNSYLISLETQQKRIAFSNFIDRSEIAPLFDSNILLGLHVSNFYNLLVRYYFSFRYLRYGSLYRSCIMI